jgi:hypothetical protein
VSEGRKAHIDLVVHGDLDELSREELLRLRRLVYRTERYVRRRQRHESRPYWQRFLYRWAQAIYQVSFPLLGAWLWLQSIYHGLLVPFGDLPPVRLVWTVLRAVWFHS